MASAVTLREKLASPVTFTCLRKISSCAIFFLLIVSLRLAAEWVKPNVLPI
jgi:hypothetical protein